MLSVPLSTAPMEARLEDALPEGRWQYEPKWDGFRCLAFRDGARVELRSKSGTPLTRYYPEVVEFLASVPAKQFVLDGELVIPVGKSLSFDVLQMRLHPAESRVRKLAKERPALYIVFDCLMNARGKDLRALALPARREELEKFFEKIGSGGLRLSPYTRKRSEALKWLAKAGGALDGVVAKPLDGPYRSGERAMVKVKRIRTADCVVGGFRYGTNSRLVGSLLLGLYNDEGKLDHVGFTSGIHDHDRAALTTRVEKLKGGPGFTGNAPGGPSRWSTERTGEWEPLKPKLVCEVRYDHISENRFRHGTRFLRWRSDKAPKQCTFGQLEREARPSKLVGMITR